MSHTDAADCGLIVRVVLGEESAERGLDLSRSLDQLPIQQAPLRVPTTTVYVDRPQPVREQRGYQAGDKRCDDRDRELHDASTVNAEVWPHVPAVYGMMGI